MEILRFLNYRRMPWKNGGGETVEIYALPKGTNLDNFCWRISMAKVESDGPFSQFNNTRRTISILEGHGITLSVEGMNPIHLKSENSPFSFDANAPTHAVLIDGAITDLNVMSRGAGHSCQPLEGPSTHITMAFNTIFFSTSQMQIVADNEHVTLQKYDCAIVEGIAKTIRIMGGSGFVIEFI